MVMSIKWGEEYWSLRPCSMSLVSLCQLWRLRPCRSWPRSGLHVLEPPSWLVPSESYQAVLPTGPTFPCSRPVEPGLRMPGGDLNADLKRTLSGQLLPRGRIAWREEDAFVWPPLLRVRLREWRRLDLRTSPSAAAPPHLHRTLPRCLYAVHAVHSRPQSPRTVPSSSSAPRELLPCLMCRVLTHSLHLCP